MGNKGQLITFEGQEGSGKTTQIKLLIKYLEDRGLDCILSREPGGTSIGDEIRKILLEGRNYRISPFTELFLFLASRAEHVKEVVKPALESGKIVILDRFSDSSIVYQGYGREIGHRIVERLNRYAVSGINTDITFILDYPIEKGLERSLARLNEEQSLEDRIERESILFHKRIRKGYIELSKREPDRIVVIDANASEKVIHNRIIKIVEERL